MGKGEVAVGQESRANENFDGASRIEARIGALLGDCIQVFRAFSELAELAENLRILSLNAELAAGRAGDKGRAVRALTQYTRELVNRLAQVQTETAGLMSHTYGLTAAILREHHQHALIERAVGAITAGSGTMADSASRRLEEASVAMTGTLARSVERMVEYIERMSARTRAVAEVVSASDSIATNIAIEAVGAGLHEAEFRTVADTMRRYVEELRTIMEQAGAAVRSAVDKGVALQRINRSGQMPAARQGVLEA